jgi:hypothetical protein
MSLTQVRVPREFSFAEDYLWVEYSSTNIAQEGFRYQVKLYVTDGTANTLIATTRVRPNFSGYLLIDISSFISARLEPDFKDVWEDTNAFTPVITAGAQVQVKVKEWYDNAEQGTEDSYTFYVVKGYGQQSEGTRPDRSKFIPSLSSITNGSLNVFAHYAGGGGNGSQTPWRKIPRGLDFFVSFCLTDQLNSDTDPLSYLRIFYEGGSTELEVALTPTSGLSQLPSTTLTNGNFYHVINLAYYLPDADTGRRRMSLHNDVVAGLNKVTTQFRLELVPRQSKHDDLTLVWLNEFGGLETMYIDGRIKKTQETSNETMQRLVSNMDGTLSFDKYRHTTMPYHMTATTKMQALKNHLEDYEVHLCRSAVRSRQVWLREGDGDYQPVIINGIDFDDNTHPNTKLRPAKFQFTLATEQRC